VGFGEFLVVWAVFPILWVSRGILGTRVGFVCCGAASVDMRAMIAGFLSLAAPRPHFGGTPLI
jgi:hypothetical protein